MKKKAIPFLAGAALLTLSACGGGSSPPLATPESVQELAGLTPPVETPEDQRKRAPDLLARSDSLFLSTVYGETDSAQAPTYRLLAECSGRQCTLTNSINGQSQVTGISDLTSVSDGTRTLGTKHGVTLTATATRYMGQDVTAFGAWLDHSAFAAQTQRGMVENVTIVGRYGIAGGILTGARPTGGATWLGLMAGTPATGSNRGDRLVGTAALNYDIALDTLDVAFSNIVNIDRGRDHSVALVRFEDLEIGSGGTFQAGASGNRIQGGLYGPGHAEAAGIFEQSNIVGAFGAKRSAQ